MVTVVFHWGVAAGRGVSGGTGTGNGDGDGDGNGDRRVGRPDYLQAPARPGP